MQLHRGYTGTAETTPSFGSSGNSRAQHSKRDFVHDGRALPWTQAVKHSPAGGGLGFGLCFAIPPIGRFTKLSAPACLYMSSKEPAKGSILPNSQPLLGTLSPSLSSFFYLMNIHCPTSINIFFLKKLKEEDVYANHVDHLYLSWWSLV